MNVYIVWRLNRLLKTNKIAIKYASKLKWFPIIQIIVFLPQSIDHLCRIMFETRSFALVLIKIITTSSSGFLFCVIYGLNPFIQSKIREYLCCCCMKNSIAPKLRLSEVIEVNESTAYINNSNISLYEYQEEKSAPPTPEKRTILR